MTTANFDGESIELAKYTLEVAEDLEKVGKEKNIRVKAEKMYKALGKVVGEDILSELVDGTDYSNCDLTKLANMFNIVNDAYTADMNRHTDEKVRENMEKIADMGKQIESFSAAAKRANNIDR